VKALVPIVLAAVALALFQVAVGGNPDFQYFTIQAMLVGVNVLLAVSLNLINGLTGQFSIGHAGFMAAGAWASALVTSAARDFKVGFLGDAMSDQLFFMLALLVAAAVAGTLGFLVGLPSLRLKGDYLAIVTLGFGEIIMVFIRNTPSLGGSLGFSGMPRSSSVFAVWFCVFLAVLFSKRLLASRHGRNLLAIREDEIAAESMGVDVTAYKVRAFVVSSALAGVAGGLFAHTQDIIAPGDNFSFVKSMEIVVMIVAGGLGSTSGAVIAGMALSLLPEAMRSLFMSFGGDGNLAQSADQMRKPIFGLLLVVMMLVRPQGLFGTHEIWDWLKRKTPKGAA
jgi:branched-chain amino acid transport system permease protein